MKNRCTYLDFFFFLIWDLLTVKQNGPLGYAFIGNLFMSTDCRLCWRRSHTAPLPGEAQSLVFCPFFFLPSSPLGGLVPSPLLSFSRHPERMTRGAFCGPSLSFQYFPPSWEEPAVSSDQPAHYRCSGSPTCPDPLAFNIYQRPEHPSRHRR